MWREGKREEGKTAKGREGRKIVRDGRKGSSEDGKKEEEVKKASYIKRSCRERRKGSCEEAREGRRAVREGRKGRRAVRKRRKRR